MKKLLLLLALALPMLTMAQSKYEFSTETRAYTPLTNPDNTYTTWMPTKTVTIYMSGDYKAFGKTYNMNANTLSLLHAGGFVSCDDGINIFFFKGISDINFVPRAGGLVAVKVEGTGNTKTFKAEWKNVGVKDAPDSIYANFQIWWEAASGRVSVHMGPHNLTKAHFSQGKGASVGMFLASSNLTQLKETCFLEGSVDSPTVNRVNFTSQMDGVPAANTLYHFNRSSDPASVSLPSFDGLVSVWPNPVADKLVISTSIELQSAVLTDMLGHEVKVLTRGSDEMEMGDLPAGFYVLTMQSTSYGIISKKILRK